MIDNEYDYVTSETLFMFDCGMYLGIYVGMMLNPTPLL